MDEDENPPEVGHSSSDDRKHVTVNDEPEVFTIRPDTTAVEKQERPKLPKLSLESAPEQLSPEERASIVKQTTDLIKYCEDKVISQKLNGAKLGFMLLRVEESLLEYNKYLGLLDRFIVNGDEITSQYFTDVCENLPPYGDYLKSLGDVSDSKLAVNEIDGLLEKTDLENFVKDIQNNAYIGGKFLKSFRVTNKSINNYMREKRAIGERISKQIKSWLRMKNVVTNQLDYLRDSLYSLSAHLDFVKSGETKIKPAPDIFPSFPGSSTSSINNSFRPIAESTRYSENNSFGPSFGENSVSSINNSFRPIAESTRYLNNNSFNRKSGNNSFSNMFEISAIPAETEKFVIRDIFSTE